MFRFENSTYLMWIFILVPLLGLSYWSSIRARSKIKKGFGEKISPFLTSSVSVRKRRWKIFLQSIALALMLLAYARPQMGQSQQEIKSEGIEIMLVADVSESMMADDIRPSRLEQMKIDLSKWIDMQVGNKIGLVAFAGSSALLSPLTNDPSSLKLFVDSLSTSSVSSQGTNFKEALEDAKSAFDRGGVDQESSKATRVILVFSDGEDHEPGALEYAKKLADQGIRIFTIAYGTEKGAPIPQRDSLGYLKGYKKDEKGSTIMTAVKGDNLKLLAESGRGGFYFASTGVTYLKSLLDDLNKLEKKEFESKLATQYDEKFQIILFIAFLLGLLELWLGDRASSHRIWKGRFETSIVLLCSMSFLFSFDSSVASAAAASELTNTHYLSTRAVELNKQGVELFKNQNFFGAHDKFMKSLAEDPFSAEILFNLGLTFDALEKKSESIQSYEQALKYSNSEDVKFRILFNLGEMKGREKKIDEALAYYQAALEFKPDSIEVKTNIELLTAQSQGGDGKESSDSGEGKQENSNKKNDKNDKDNKNSNDNKDNQNQKDQKKDSDKQKEDKAYEKPKPQPFKSNELNTSDVKKIIEELDRQEQRVRAEYNKKTTKERAQGKDW